jgi:hypothetical protein
VHWRIVCKVFVVLHTLLSSCLLNASHAIVLFILPEVCVFLV